MDAIFWTLVLAEGVLLACLILSWAWPRARVWPPPGPGSWQLWFVWTLTIAVGLGTVAVGLLDWNTFVFSHPARIAVGVLLATGGNVLAFWGVATIGGRATTGVEVQFVPTGPYRWTRNPQYVGDIVVLLGWAILCNSSRTWILCLLGSACFALTPFAEEPWLRATYGPTYDEYRKRVPRFLGLWPVSRREGRA